MKSDKYCIFCISILKLLKQFATIQSNHYHRRKVIAVIEEIIIVIRDPKTFCFHFDQPKDVNENLKHEIKFIIKSN